VVISGHVTKMAVTPVDPSKRKPNLHANLTALCVIETESWPIEVVHCRNRDFLTDMYKYSIQMPYLLFTPYHIM